MRAPKGKRPPRRSIDPAGLAVAQIASKVRYIGSPEHKDMPSFAGRAKPRADASICPRELTENPTRVLRWLRAAIRKGVVSEQREGGFPRYVWYMDDETVYEARLVNRGNGEYKGFPLRREEWPRGIENYYD